MLLQLQMCADRLFYLVRDWAVLLPTQEKVGGMRQEPGARGQQAQSLRIVERQEIGNA